jgi:tetratricopeptide (TPR) repeat protein
LSSEIENQQIDLQQLQGWLQDRQYDRSLAYLNGLLVNDPSNTDALYFKAVTLRYLHQYETAGECLETLRQLEPNHSRALQEQGHLLRDQKRFEEAMSFYQMATRQNPSLIASWQAQQQILKNLGQNQAASSLQEQIDHLRNMPKPLLAVMDLVARGKLIRAEELVRAFLQKVPHHVEAMRLLADIGVRLGILDDAEFLLEAAVKLEPNNLQLHVDYLQTLRKRQKFAAAFAEASWLLEQRPDNPQFQSLYAIEAMQTGDYETAVKYLDSVLERIPGEPTTLTTRGHALKTAGQQEEAIASYRSAISSQERHGEAWYSLSNLKTYRFDDGEVSTMQRLEAEPSLTPTDRVHLDFALGKAFEDRKDYAKSFDYYSRGNQIKKIQSRYNADSMTAELASQQTIVDRALIDRFKGAGCPADDPIFILGMPRAGSTLLEQILSSHSQVDGTLELPNILALAQRLRRGDRISGKSHYPEVLTELSAQQYREFGEKFIEDTKIHRKGAPFFIDKMPNNFRHVGLIKLMLPNAKIIDARRSAPACCFGGFKQMFAEGQEFSYDLADIGQYYRDYVDLMDHWQAVFPGEILLVEYENVVADLEGQVRRLLDFCGLDFEESCLNYHETKRAVRTASSEQVRQPIYTTGVDQWTHYREFLQPLKDALGPRFAEQFDV